MTNRRPATRPGWWRFFVAAFVAVFVGLLGTTLASAASRPSLDTRVAAAPVGVVGAESPTVATCTAATYSYDTTLSVVHIDSDTVAGEARSRCSPSPPRGPRDCCMSR